MSIVVLSDETPVARKTHTCSCCNGTIGVGDTTATQFYSAAAVYCITPTTEDVARSVAARNQPAPVSRWELSKPVDADVLEDDEF